MSIYTPSNTFENEVAEQLGWYVYRLLDPRNGETFYVGKGTGNRIFDHVSGALRHAERDDDVLDLKHQRIRDIHTAGLEVVHLIHRHGINSAGVAYQIEAALIDAYPGLANRIRGHGAGEKGCRSAFQIISEYQAAEAAFVEPCIVLSIGSSYYDMDRDVYNAVRRFWSINPSTAGRFKLVLARRRATICGAFRPAEWLEALRSNFPEIEVEEPGKYGFNGKKADDVWDSHVGRRVPNWLCTQNPVRYWRAPQ